MFNARAAKALQPGDHMVIDEAPGLRLVATETRRTWTYRFKSPVDGNMRQMKLGEWPAMPFAGAFAAWDAARQLRSTGVDPSAQRKADRVLAASPAPRAVLSVRDVCDEYLAAHRGTVVAKTWAEIDRLLAREIDSIAALPAASITRAHAFDLLDPMRSRPGVAGRLRQSLGAAWDRALDAGRMPPETPNWWRLVLRGKLPSQGKRVDGERVGTGKRVLTEVEVGTLLRWLPNFSRDIEDVLTMYLWTCCRGAEILAAEKTEITREPDGVWWTVPRGKLKVRRNPLTVDLRVPLVGRALAVVERRLAAGSGPWLFPTPGRGKTHILRNSITAAVWSHMPYAGTRPEWTRVRLPVTHWAPHDLRRTGRTMLAALECPDNIAEAILGHMAGGVVGVYDRYGYDPQRRVWLTALATRLESLAAGSSHV